MISDWNLIVKRRRYTYIIEKFRLQRNTRLPHVQNCNSYLIINKKPFFLFTYFYI